MTEQPTSTAKRNCDGQPSLAPATCYASPLVTLYNADCLDFLPTEADVLVTDPPYGANNASGWNGLHGKCKIANDGSTALRDAILAAWADKPAIVFGSWRVARPATTKAVLIWDKGGHSGMGDLSFPWKPNFEEIYVIGSGFAGRRTSSVLAHYIHPTFNATRIHPTEKPLSLMMELVRKCPPGVVLDPCMGGGTTGVACVKQGRKFIGIEKDTAHFLAAVERIKREESQGTLL
jgi:DNA modification methylase